MNPGERRPSVSYKVNVFRATWEIRAHDPDRRICEGPLPYDMESAKVLALNWDKAVRVVTDDEVRTMMKAWTI